MTRYRMTTEDLGNLLKAQDGKCAICGSHMVRVCIDHCHQTGAVRGLLCHACNIKLPAIENETYRTAALAYLARQNSQ
jgi:hypothetical protein